MQILIGVISLLLISKATAIPVNPLEKRMLAGASSSIKSVSSGLYLDGGGPNDNNPRLVDGSRNPTTDQHLQWIIGDAGNNKKFIKSISSAHYLDGRNPGMSDPLLASADRNPATDQYLQWIITDLTNGKKSIMSVSSGQYLDGRNPGMSDSYLSSGSRNPETDQYLQWIIKPTNPQQSPPPPQASCSDQLYGDSQNKNGKHKVNTFTNCIPPHELVPANQVKTTQTTVNPGVVPMIDNMNKARNYNGGHKSEADYKRDNDFKHVVNRLTGESQKGEVRHKPVDVIRQPDGSFISLDNKRIVAANAAGKNVPYIPHNPTDPLPADQLGRFVQTKGPRAQRGREATTWGEAVEIRIINQGKVTNDDGSKVAMPAKGLAPSDVRLKTGEKFDDGKYGKNNQKKVDALNMAKQLHDKAVSNVGGPDSKAGKAIQKLTAETTKGKAASVGISTGLGAGIRILEHHMYKDAPVDKVGASVGDAYHRGEGGEAFASAPKAEAYHIRNGNGVKVGAGASVGRARAQSDGIPECGGVGAAYAEAEAPNANSFAEASVLGVKCGAMAELGHVSVGFDGTPVQASASGPAAGASAGFHANQIGASVGLHAGEANALGFGVRAGVKFGGGIENGIPVIHAGPVSAPCCIM